MEPVKIIIQDPVWAKVITGHKIVEVCLSYVSKFVVEKKYGKEIKEYKKSFLIGNLFYSGFIDFVQYYCKSNNVECEITDNSQELRLEPENEPFVDGVVLNKGKYGFQYELIQQAIKNQRGVIKSATGSGKTVMILGLISCFPSSKILFLSDSKTPIMNFQMECEDRGLTPENVHLSTIQGVYKNPDPWKNTDIILIDECHSGMNSPNGMYKKFLTEISSPIRIGFTATYPETEVGKLLMMGLLGPKIGEFTIQEGVDTDVLTKPQIIVKKIPENTTLQSLTYRQVYERGIVNNRALNLQIVDDIKDAIDNNESSLVLITEIEHGENIVEMAKKVHNLNLHFVFGETEMDTRIKIARALGKKDIDGVVATSVFKKALNVPSLDHVMLGFGGKAHSSLLQSIGRGLRPADGKIVTKIHDYFNPSSKHLVKHFGYRLCTYFEEGWIGKYEYDELKLLAKFSTEALIEELKRRGIKLDIL